MSLIVDPQLCRVVAQTTDVHLFECTHFLVIPEPDGFTFDEMDDWRWNGESLVRAIGYGLTQSKSAAIDRIKAEAAQGLSALDWKLARAKERELAGWGSLADVATVLAEREAIRQSSSAAEARVNALTDAEEVNEFTWDIDVAVTVPRLVSQNEFSRRFTDDELTRICEAAKGYSAIAAWLERFRAATTLDLDNESLRTGVTALEMAGLLSAGRAQEILA